MNLLRLAGFAQAPSREKVGDKGLAALVAVAEQMARAGVVLTTDFWAGCEEYERECLAQAGDRVWADRAALIGIASQGPRGAALLTAHRDGGAALEAVDDAQERARNAQANDATTKQLFGHADVSTDNVLTRLPTTVKGG